jgi:uncharacterized protein
MRSLILFFLLACGISWLIWAPLWLPEMGVTGLPVLPLNHALGGLGPLIAGFICANRVKGRQGVRLLLRSMIDVRSPILVLVALLAPFALLAIAMLYDAQALDLPGILHNREFPAMGFLVFLFYNLIFFGFGEEVGWRGFALPRMQQHMNALWASVLLTLFWALWHLPLFLYRPGYVSMDAAAIAGWLFSLLTGSVLLTWLFNSSRSSLLVVAIFHATVDIAFTCEAATPSVVGAMGFLITLWGIATVVIMKPRDLSRIGRMREVDV